MRIEAGVLVMQNRLLINGQEVVLNAQMAIRWVDTANGQSYPVLYKNGKRVVEAWSIELNHNSPPDPFGGNANTT